MNEQAQPFIEEDFEWSEFWVNGIDQRTKDWFEVRAGKFTASTFGEVLWDATPYKTGPRAGQPREYPKSRWDEIDRVVAEVICGGPKETRSAYAMEYGRKMEPQAVAAYEERAERMIEQCGFMRHPTFEFAGCSPDFLLDDNGGGEIKCPLSIVVHATTIRQGLPPEHIEQIQGALWVTGREFWEFVSYNPRFPGRLALYIQRVYRDEVVIQKIQQDVLSAWEHAQKLIARFKEMQ
jgi:hypothetical protein